MKNIIDREMKLLWENDIAADYDNGRLLKEDSLKNAFYYHLRRRLGDVFLDEHDLQIYTEFDEGPLKGTGKRADLAIVKLNYEDDSEYWGEAVKEIVAIVELKYKANRMAGEAIMSDVEKIHSYIVDNHIDCQYYLGAIREVDWDQDHYIDEKSEWAIGRVTELVASYDENEEMQFRVFETK